MSNTNKTDSDMTVRLLDEKAAYAARLAKLNGTPIKESNFFSNKNKETQPQKTQDTAASQGLLEPLEGPYKAPEDQTGSLGRIQGSDATQGILEASGSPNEKEPVETTPKWILAKSKSSFSVASDHQLTEKDWRRDNFRFGFLPNSDTFDGEAILEEWGISNSRANVKANRIHALQLLCTNSIGRYKEKKKTWLSCVGDSKKFTGSGLSYSAWKVVKDRAIELGYYEEHESSKWMKKGYLVHNPKYDCKQSLTTLLYPSERFMEKYVLPHEWVKTVDCQADTETSIFYKMDIKINNLSRNGLVCQKKNGRYHHDLSNETKEARATMTINGEAVDEHDIEACHLTIAKHEVGSEVTSDPYDFSGTEFQKAFPVRDDRKSIIMMMINCEDKMTVNESTGITTTKTGLSTFLSALQGKYGLTHLYIKEQIISVVEEKHADIKHIFFRGNARFQEIEGKILEHLKKNFQEISLVPYHDGFCCGQKDSPKMKAAIIQSWQVVVGTTLKPNVRVKKTIQDTPNEPVKAPNSPSEVTESIVDQVGSVTEDQPLESILQASLVAEQEKINQLREFQLREIQKAKIEELYSDL